MPKFKINRGFSMAGTYSEKVVECDDIEHAEELANEWALDRLEFWAEPVEDEKGD